MKNEKENLKGPEGQPESPEAKAEEELLKLGLTIIPENIQAVMDLQKTMQHPEGFERMVETDSLDELRKEMKEKNIKEIIHTEDPSLWIHTKLAITLAGLMDISEEKKADLKLIMLYHDLGKVGMKDTPEIKKIQKKELEEGKLYKVAKGHALARSKDIENGFRANGLEGEKLKFFMRIVENHMETQLAQMPGHQLVSLFRKFGTDDEKIRDAAELLALAIQVDDNACSQVELRDDGRLGSFKEENKTGYDFDKIWARYQEAKKEPGID